MLFFSCLNSMIPSKYNRFLQVLTIGPLNEASYIKLVIFFMKEYLCIIAFEYMCRITASLHLMGKSQDWVQEMHINANQLSPTLCIFLLNFISSQCDQLCSCTFSPGLYFTLCLLSNSSFFILNGLLCP